MLSLPSLAKMLNPSKVRSNSGVSDVIVRARSLGTSSLCLCFQACAKLSCVTCKVPSLGLLVVRRMGSISEMLTAIPLHQRPDLLEACADLINEEWKKSKTSRLHSLQRSSDNFPTCLVLIRTPKTVEETADGKMAKSQSQLLGHARLSRVVSQPKSLFVETVVVAKALRGKGYGRKLMEAVESYATSRGYRRLHLTTHDKQHFYAHLGFVLSTPVQCAGFMSSIVPLGFLESLSPSQPGRELHAASAKHHPSASYSRSLLLPPPPPPVPPSTVLSPGHADSHKPASSSPSGIKTQGQLLVDTPYRDLKGQPIFWMEKDI
uniref:N-alpha-acetyltransferase 80 n=1 Tax=Varanus komodoensis TaxID=61221 RepID=A0A8D2Q5X7_VARKO